MCIIYSYTCMWSTQQLDSPPSPGNEVTQCSSEILALASDIIQRRQFDYRFIVFPTFIAGFAATSSTDKMLALDLINTMEQESIGNNTRATRKLLQAIYEKQNASMALVGHARDVDWIQLMHERHLDVISFGL